MQRKKFLFSNPTEIVFEMKKKTNYITMRITTTTTTTITTTTNE